MQLVRLPPKIVPPPPPAPRNAPPAPTVASPPHPIELHQPPPLPPTAAIAPPPLEISPEWRVKRGGAGGVDLDAAPFVLGRAGLKRAREPKADCKTHGWNRPLSCPPDATELAAARSDPAKDSKTSPFAGEAAHKNAMKGYHEAPGDAGYPGLRCAILHRC